MAAQAGASPGELARQVDAARFALGKLIDLGVRTGPR